MGVVYQAQHVHLGRTVALKLLVPELSENEDFRARFLRESRLAATLDHPGIVTIYDAGDVNGVLYLAMRFVRGTDLAALLAQRGPLAATETLAILEQVAAALDAAHAAGLVHRDVKPANVMIEGERCYLTDFGLTKRASSDSMQLTAAGQFLGTVDYVAPEQIEGREIDGRADVYALGCVLFECLTGSRPYPRDSQVAILYAQLREPPPRPCELRPDLPAAIDSVVGRAMAKAPADRYTSCSEMVVAARTALAAPAAPTVPVEIEPQPHEPQPHEPQPHEPQPHEPQPHDPDELSEGPELPTAPLPAEPVTAVLESKPLRAASKPARPDGAGRRRVNLIATAVAVVGVVAGIAISASGGGDHAKKKTGSSEPPTTSGPHVVGNPIRVGDSPVGVVFRDGALWVANTTRNTVTRVAPSTGKTTTIPVGAAPFDMASNRKSVWAANSQARSVSRIALDTGKAGPQIPVGDHPYFLTAEDKAVYVSNGGDDSVTVLDAVTGKRIGEPIPVGDEPRGITTSRHAVWVANSGDGTVTQIVRSQPLVTVETGAGAANIAFKQGVIWVANRDAGTVSRITAPASGIEVTSAKVGREPLAIAFGEGYAWVANSGENTVMRLDRNSGRPVGDAIPVPGRPTGMTIADGSIWVTSNETGTISRIVP
jgi:serine/threonine-protein kinase